MNLQKHLAKALSEEFKFFTGEEESWMKAAGGVLDKVRNSISEEKLALETSGRRADETDVTLVELEMLDLEFKALGWNPDKASRSQFLATLRKDNS